MTLLHRDNATVLGQLDETGGQLSAPKRVKHKLQPDKLAYAAVGEGRIGSHPALWEADSRVSITANQHHGHDHLRHPLRATKFSSQDV